LIFQRGWILLRAPEHSSGFITSDHPFCLFWTDPKRRGGFHPPGLGLRGTEIRFTISPRLALVGAFELKNGEVDVSEEGVAGINGGVIALAEAQVYARDQNFHYAMQSDEPLQKASRLIITTGLRVLISNPNCAVSLGASEFGLTLRSTPVHAAETHSGLPRRRVRADSFTPR
jgi:Protein of unknown function (DUF4238)